MVVPFSPPDINEDDIALVCEALRSGWITTGPKTKEFERMLSEYCGTNRAVALNSATACLELTLRVLGIGRGDEVIVTAYTYTASASVIEHVGATPVIIDIDEDNFFISVDNIEKAITDKTKAIIAVDYAGVPVDYKPIFDVVNKHKDKFAPANDIQKAMGRIAVIADAAHSLGAKRDGKMSGNLADFTSFSFHAVKNLTTAEGGGATWKTIDGIDDEWIYKQFMLLSLHGQDKDALAKTQKGSWRYDIKIPGYKCNMTDMAAGLGISQLKRYGSLLERRHEIVETYNKAFENIACVKPLMHTTEEYDSSCHLYIVRIDGISEADRDDIIMQMAEKDVVTNVHYIPLPMHTAYKNMGFDIKDFPNAYNQYKNQISLPLYSILTPEAQQYVIDSFIEVLKGKGLC